VIEEFVIGVTNILPTVILCSQHYVGIKKSKHYFIVNSNTLREQWC